MAIVKLQPDSPPLTNQTIPETIPDIPKSIFTSLVPESRINSLLKYVEGYPWTVVYYGQLLNTNNTLENFDPSSPDLTQSYYKINDLILQVSSPLTSSYDSSTGITAISGSAIAPYRVTPNVGDVFLAQVDSGEDAIFHVTTVSRKTHFKDTLYEISYTLYSYTSADPSFLETLNTRINTTYYFNKDSNFFNRDILVKPSVKEATDRLKLFIKDSQHYYLDTFSKKQTGSILIPGLDSALYDPLLLNFLSKIIPYTLLVTTPFFRHSYVSTYIDQPSLFDLILSRSKVQLPNINKTYNFIYSNELPNRARLGTLSFTGADYILYPTNPFTNADINSRPQPNRSLFIDRPISVKNYSTITPIIIETTNNNRIYSKPLLHELFYNDYYLVSENFYNYLNNNTNYDSISYIEFLIAKHINGDAIAKEDLVIATESWQRWSLLHQLYLLPIMQSIVNNNLV